MYEHAYAIVYVSAYAYVHVDEFVPGYALQNPLVIGLEDSRWILGKFLGLASTRADSCYEP